MGHQITILVHGFNRNKSDMAFLARGLKKIGHDVLTANLPTTFCTLETCCNVLHAQVSEITKQAETVNFVAHSMGGLITRSFIEREKQNNVANCVFIATPHHGSKLAELANTLPFFTAVFKPIGDLLPKAHICSAVSQKTFKIGVIAGSNNKGILGKLFLSPKSDGRVEIASAQAPDMDDCVILPYGHNDIHHREKTLVLVNTFLRQGRFFGPSEIAADQHLFPDSI